MNWQKIKENVLATKSNEEGLANARKLQAAALLSAGIMLLINGVRIYDHLIDPENGGLPLPFTTLLFLGMLCIWYLGRRGFIKTSAWLLISAYGLPTIFCFYYWGADLPAAIMMTVLIVMMAGIFLGSRPALSVAISFISAIFIISYLQVKKLIPINDSWRQAPNQLADSFVYTLIFSIIFLLAWTIVRENKRALKAATVARLELEKERDQLEITVAARTKAITEMRREKLGQLQTLASIGQLSGGIFHDIINPLTVVNLNLEQLRTEHSPHLDKSQDYLQQALAALKRIQELINSANACLRRQSQEKYFSVRTEIEQIKKIMDSQAKENKVNIELEVEEDSEIKGNPTRFSQVMMNLLKNAIEACAQTDNNDKKISIWLGRERPEQIVKIQISDNGSGIAEEDYQKIFEAFFSTKNNNGKNIGLGLSLVKEIVEQDFNGNIKVESCLGEKSTFIIQLPVL